MVDGTILGIRDRLHRCSSFGTRFVRREIGNQRLVTVQYINNRKSAAEDLWQEVGGKRSVAGD